MNLIPALDSLSSESEIISVGELGSRWALLADAQVPDFLNTFRFSVLPMLHPRINFISFSQTVYKYCVDSCKYIEKCLCSSSTWRC